MVVNDDDYKLFDGRGRAHNLPGQVVATCLSCNCAIESVGSALIRKDSKSMLLLEAGLTFSPTHRPYEMVIRSDRISRYPRNPVCVCVFV